MNKVPRARSPFMSQAFENITWTVGAEAANAIDVTVKLTDANGKALAVRGCLFCYLSDDANGDSLAAAAPSGGWAIQTDGLQIPVVTGKAAFYTSEANGQFKVRITEATAKSFWVVAVMPDGSLKTRQVTFA